jgi:hypothetical protein
MIERYTIKFGPAVSQKELAKALHESEDTPNPRPHEMNARIEIVAGVEDLKKIMEVLKEMGRSV